MPNTLAHLGIQSLLSRALLRRADLRWIAVGCVIPDLPWIARRILAILVPGLDAYDLQLYTIVQASLIFCLVLCGCLALLSHRPGVTFGLLAGNCGGHLILDGLQTKWGNGVHLLAPFTWHDLNLGLFWPESLVAALLTAGGLAVVIVAWWRPAKPVADPPGLNPVAGPGLSVGRFLPAAALAVAYLLLPLALLAGPEAADSHSIATLREREARPGREVALDRVPFGADPAGKWVHTLAGERLRVSGLPAQPPGMLSVRGRFTDAETIQVIDRHRHLPWVRDLASYAGLAAILLLWLRSWWYPCRQGIAGS